MIEQNREDLDRHSYSFCLFCAASTVAQRHCFRRERTRRNKLRKQIGKAEYAVCTHFPRAHNVLVEREHNWHLYPSIYKPHDFLCRACCVTVKVVYDCLQFSDATLQNTNHTVLHRWVGLGFCFGLKGGGQGKRDSQ
jgi:hypothetical protein